jgi:hypothetical protein
LRDINTVGIDEEGFWNLKIYEEDDLDDAYQGGD